MSYRNLLLDRVNLYLGEELKEGLRKLSKKRGFTMSGMVKLLIRDEIERQKRKE